MGNKKLIQVVFNYGIAILLLSVALVILFRNPQYRQLILKVSVFEILMSSALCTIIFAAAGYKTIYLARQCTHEKLELSEALFLPVMMNLFSFLIPVKGGNIFMLTYLKMRYKISLVAGISISTTSYLTMLVLYGFICLILLLLSGTCNLVALLLILLFILSPFTIIAVNVLLKKIRLSQNAWVNKLQRLFQQLGQSLYRPWTQWKVILVLMMITAFRTVLKVIWNSMNVSFFGFNVPFQAIIMSALLTEISGAINFIPGNLGLIELVSGGAFGLVGASVEIGILVALYQRFISTIVTLIFGIPAFQTSLKYVDMNVLKSSWKLNAEAKNKTNQD